MVVLGADPGETGGFVAIINTEPAPTLVDVVSLKLFLPNYTDILRPYPRFNAVLEKVGPITGDTPITAFTLGASWGALRWCLVHTAKELRQPPPAEWQYWLWGEFPISHDLQPPVSADTKQKTIQMIKRACNYNLLQTGDIKIPTDAFDAVGLAFYGMGKLFKK